METVDCLVIGSGVVGLAIARELSLSGREVIVAEKATKVSIKEFELVLVEGIQGVKNASPSAFLLTLPSSSSSQPKSFRCVNDKGM